MAKQIIEDDDPLDRSDFAAAEGYIAEHPEYALCRIKHDVRFHEKPADMEYLSHGGYVHIYSCHGCGQTYKRAYFADGRYDQKNSGWKYEKEYLAPKGVGYALMSRSGKAAFNLALNDMYFGNRRRPKR